MHSGPVIIGFGATLAHQAGFDAEGLAVADEATVADTLIRIDKGSASQPVP